MHRVGKKLEQDQVTDGQENSIRNRPMRVMLESEEVKWKVVKAAPDIKKVKQAALFKSHEVFITPEYTILQRERELQAIQELKKKRAIDPNGGWKKGFNFRLIKRPVPQSQD